MEREAFEEWIKPWLWLVEGTLETIGPGPYRNAAVQLAWQAWEASRKGGFLSTGPIDLELP